MKKALSIGFSTDHIVFAGVGKSDAEINLGLDSNIFCFNCESLQELIDRLMTPVKTTPVSSLAAALLL